MKVKTMLLKMESDQTIREDASKLRGFFARKFNSYLLLHNHLGNNKFLYQYPRIQYKTINHTKMILGLSEGVDVLQSIYNQYDQIVLDGHAYQIFSKAATPTCGENQRELAFTVVNGYLTMLVHYSLNSNNFRVSEATQPLLQGIWYHIVMNFDGNQISNNGLDQISFFVNNTKSHIHSVLR